MNRQREESLAEVLKNSHHLILYRPLSLKHERLDAILSKMKLNCYENPTYVIHYALAESSSGSPGVD